ncbi:helix-turn-helix domain-containing protein [Robertkochia flava]|uniref:helix-turn-helix domain-containing protein n=1 Tax=Robertkochia flava TaxID=3447986 RepID=UPI001CCFEB18|nr:helix-turn-helix domain-containing protein [Robertkochia marina]
MPNIKNLIKIDDYCTGLQLETLHPLVSIVDLSKGKWPGTSDVTSVRYHFYGVFLKQGESCVLKYGRQNYDYQDGTLVFIGPGQVVNISRIDTDYQPSGYALLFHPDFLRGTHLGSIMETYSFFSYDNHEALHISQRERLIVLDCFNKIRIELSQGIDKHSKALILSNIELFLNYCTRFYDRQFITRDNENLSIIQNFENSLKAYLKTGKAKEYGIPSVKYFADQLHLSANYFGDLVKRETGVTAQDYIQMKIIDAAKDMIFDPDLSISEIAYTLGFKYPQHFSRLFKKRVGHTPQEYRSMN